MNQIEEIALRVANSMDIKIIPCSNNSKTSNYHLGVNKLNITTKYPSWFYLGYSEEVQIRVNDIIKNNFDKIIQQRVYEILSKNKW